MSGQAGLRFRPQQTYGHPWKHSRRRVACRMPALAGLLAILCCLTPSRVEGKLRVQPKWEHRESVEMTCALESFYVLEGSSLAKQAGVPTCHTDQMFHISRENGAVYFKKHPLKGRSAPHFFGTYSAPWFLEQVIKDGRYETRNIDLAQLVYVDMYCYYMWWMAVANSPDPSKHDSPGFHLVKLYEEVMQMDRWKTANGRDFVFFMPYGLQQVWHSEHARPDGGAMQPYLNIVCKRLHRSLQIMVESMQMNICKQSKEDVLIAPFVPNVLEVKGNALMESLTAMERHLNGYKNRTMLVQFKGQCNSKSHNPSRMLRTKVAEAMQDQGEDVDVSCIDTEGDGDSGRLPFEQLLAEMERSMFCLVLPENGQSTRLLSEIIIAGCIPVFLGPPFGAMPFSKDIDFSSFSVIIQLRDNKDWMEPPSLRRTDKSALTAELWQDPIIDEQQMDEELDTINDVLPFLRAIPKDVQMEGLKMVAGVRRNFMFFPELDAENPSAADLMLLNLCRRMNTLQNSPKDEAPEAKTTERASSGAVKPAEPSGTASGKPTSSSPGKQKVASKGKAQSKAVDDAKEKQSLPGTKSGGKTAAKAGVTTEKQSLPGTITSGKQGTNAGTWKAGSMTASQASKSGDEDPVGSWGDEDDVENIEEAWVPQKQTPGKASVSKKKATGSVSGDEVSGSEMEVSNERMPVAMKSGKAITKADLDVSIEDEYDYENR